MVLIVDIKNIANLQHLVLSLVGVTIDAVFLPMYVDKTDYCVKSTAKK